MAYQRLTPVLTSADGALPVDELTDEINGNVVINANTITLELENTTAAPVAVTFVTSATVQGYAVEDHTVTLEAAEKRTYGHFPTEVFGPDLAFTSDAPITARVYR
ncbi:hypothetical protein LHJ74_30665 [Streptomyces sp. N2-109]|uniref:Uncharacterized protein n=1 Tax=Streptomyces gossypii TaxID=2883101 RepID=A0ABT2K411_9ACTN|nr:hypothetical protein [Streptomyces gossypii]MCT2594219.1 hypothetical protein [Streptomyces gossypii]